MVDLRFILHPLHGVSHQIAGPKTAPCRPGANDELRANDSDQHRKNVAPYWDVRFRFRVPGVEQLRDTLSFLAQVPSDQTVGEDEEGAAEGANAPGGTPDALVNDPDAEETEAEAAGIAQDANREVCCKSGPFARGGGCAGAILPSPSRVRRMNLKRS